MSSPAASLVTTLYDRLSELSYDGADVPVYTENPPQSAEAPLLVIDRPRLSGTKTIDGRRRREARQQLRVHTDAPPGRGDALMAYDIAADIQERLEENPPEVGGRVPHVPEPTLRPIPSYEHQGGDNALDLSIEYIFHL